MAEGSRQPGKNTAQNHESDDWASVREGNLVWEQDVKMVRLKRDLRISYEAEFIQEKTTQ